jgi:hypothetical protein
MDADQWTVFLTRVLFSSLACCFPHSRTVSSLARRFPRSCAVFLTRALHAHLTFVPVWPLVPSYFTTTFNPSLYKSIQLWYLPERATLEP